MAKLEEFDVFCDDEVFTILNFDQSNLQIVMKMIFKNFSMLGTFLQAYERNLLKGC